MKKKEYIEKLLIAANEWDESTQRQQAYRHAAELAKDLDDGSEELERIKIKACDRIDNIISCADYHDMAEGGCFQCEFFNQQRKVEIEEDEQEQEKKFAEDRAAAIDDAIKLLKSEGFKIQSGVGK